MFATQHAMRLYARLLNTSSLLNIVLTGCLVFADEVGDSVLAQPVRHLGELLTETIDRLKVHVGLRNEFWKGNWKVD